MRNSMKRCNGCSEQLPMRDFCNNRSQKDGKQSQCKRCRNDIRRAYRSTEAGKVARRRSRISPTSHPKRLANKAVGRAVESGRLLAARECECELSGQGCRGELEWHHDSYLPIDRLSVRCLCKKHHVDWHAENAPTMPPIGTVEHGPDILGERNGMAVLSEAQARAIIKATGTHRAIGNEFGVSRQTVGLIRSGKRWGHLHA